MVSTLFVFADINQKDIGITAPKLVFMNPALISGKDNSEGAVYPFGNVITGVDAEIELRKFSPKDILMAEVDLAALGRGKPFQLQFGLQGYAAPVTAFFVESIPIPVIRSLSGNLVAIDKILEFSIYRKK